MRRSDPQVLSGSMRRFAWLDCCFSSFACPRQEEKPSKRSRQTCEPTSRKRKNTLMGYTAFDRTTIVQHGTFLAALLLVNVFCLAGMVSSAQQTNVVLDGNSKGRVFDGLGA